MTEEMSGGRQGFLPYLSQSPFLYYFQCEEAYKTHKYCTMFCVRAVEFTG